MTNDIAVRFIRTPLCRTVYTAGACAAGCVSYGHHIYLRGFLHPSSGRHHGVCVRAWNPACDMGIFEYCSSATKGTFGILGNIINTLYIVIITLLIATPWALDPPYT